MYTFLSLLYLIVAYWAGKSSSRAKSPKQYWKCMVWPILIYTAMYGCRYGWMIDFTYYEMEYANSARVDDQGKMGWLLYLLFRGGAVCGLSYNTIIAFLNFSLILCFCWMTYYYRRYAHWILPLFFFVSRMTANFIAFYPAIGAMCLFMTLHLRVENKFNIFKFKDGGLWMPLLVLFVAFGYHPAVIVAIILYILVLYIRLKPVYAITLYALSFAFQSDIWFDVMKIASGYLSLFSSNSTLEAYNYYAENADSFYSTHLFEGRTAPIFFYVRNFIANASAMYLYYRYTKENKINVGETKILELSTIALILTNMTEGVELFHRYAMLYRTFLPILYAFSVAQGIKSHKSKERFLAYAIIILIGQYYISDSFFSPDDGYNRLYIWDK